MIDSSSTAPSTAPAPNAARPPDDARGAVRILVVDDEETIRLALGRFLRARAYEVEAVPSGAAALAAITPGRFALMLCDVRMPGVNGVEVVAQARALDPELAVVMLSAVNDAATARAAFVAGAVDYLLKPVELAVLLQAVEQALHRRALVVKQREIERAIRDEVASATEQLERDRNALHAVSVEVAEALVTAMEAKDPFLRGASQRTADLASSIAVELRLDEDATEAVRLAGRLHDVGMIGIRESVLHKPGRLTPEEYAHVQEHVRIGLDILAPLRHLSETLRFVGDHHEHFDGKGYPRGLAGEEISIGGRILAAADAFEAITSKRSYQQPMEPAAAVAYLESRVGTLLDPAVYAALRTAVARGRALTFLE
ncbi:HD domain-containing phosphohydrolase [Roseisolibacter agri]|uniref:Two-component system response regulator n=1 Tax=Roseisolibacter agri TaxID=2014610 RepID=A0AA37Q2V8_9BACT|nr:HD domain-containing phosphohydrolase [Roseisolibacter agri]GLC25579.1 two-component system response regulator [Roseisolibacter agri]